jgi:Peptidase inhibitor I78 family
MRASRFLLASICAAGWLTSACGGNATSTSPSDPIESAVPPSVDRGPAPAPQPPPASAKCDATKAQWAIGERASMDLLDRAREAAQASVARFIRPNEAITLEFLPWRLNLGLDAHDVVKSISCG